MDLATATASPPPWLTTAYPRCCRERRTEWSCGRGAGRVGVEQPDLRRRRAGSSRNSPSAITRIRRWRCGMSPTVRLSQPPMLLRHLRECFPHLATEPLWDNGFPQRRMGTAFWSQRYTDFAQVLPRAARRPFRNPTHVLDYRRFGSDTLLGLFLEEGDPRRPVARVPVTTNFADDDRLPPPRLPPVGTPPGRRLDRSLSRRRCPIRSPSCPSRGP